VREENGIQRSPSRQEGRPRTAFRRLDQRDFEDRVRQKVISGNTRESSRHVGSLVCNLLLKQG
jgi:hypothetical protein